MREVLSFAKIKLNGWWCILSPPEARSTFYDLICLCKKRMTTEYDICAHDYDNDSRAQLSAYTALLGNVYLGIRVVTIVGHRDSYHILGICPPQIL